ncbi:MAG TPA: hypothetical protein VJK52_05580 [Candidatus Nanoarchaeia archaeon]|nr:hypothetical protein [Candidatus Nanoarchaeia archaeon]
MTLRRALRGMLTPTEQQALIGSFDVIGTIAKIEIPPALRKHEKRIAAAARDLNPAIRTVVRKAGAYHGKYRLQKVKILAGERTKVTTHRESGLSITLDIEQCYFSVRLSSERLRIAQQIQKGEKVLVMFSGVGIYPLILAKHSQAAHIWGIELNRIAHKYGLLNLQKNKIRNVTLLPGDVRKVLPKLKRKFDRILMPLPMEAEKFLPLAVKYLKGSGKVHLYTFQPEAEIGTIPEKVSSMLNRSTKARLLRTVKCGAYASRVYRVCLDLQISKRTTQHRPKLR